MGCLDDLEVLELVSGGMPAADLSRADAHLDGCEDCRSLVASVVRARRGPGAVELAPGDRVGRFLIEARRASGAMGVVFTAKDPELGRRVAIKVLRPELEGTEARARLLREAKAMASVSHPHVVAVYEVGTVGEQVFIAMELVEGTTLRAFIASAPRTTQAILDALREAGRGLAAAHAAGLVHRDFKPDNVLVATDGRVRVTDFGLAKAQLDLADEALVVGDAGEVLHTRTGALLGTPAYMAPEQLAGEAADARSDQFAFGVTLFEALYGERPFAGATVSELSASIRAKAVRTPRARRVAPAAYAAIVKALAPDPADRHQNMQALLEAVSQRPKTRLWPWLAAGGLGLAVVAGGYWVSRVAPVAPVCAKLPETTSAWDASMRDKILESFERKAPLFGGAAAREVVSAVQRWAAENERARSQICGDSQTDAGARAQRMTCLDVGMVEVRTLAQGLLDADAEEIARAAELTSASLPDPHACTSLNPGRELPAKDALARQDSFNARVMIARARSLLTLNEKLRARREAEEAVVLAKKSEHLPTVGAALLVSAEIARAEGQADAALDFAREALFALEEGRDDRGAARAWILMITVEGTRARYERASEWAGFATAALARAGHPPSLEADLSEAVGVVELGRGNIDAAAAALNAAFELTRTLGEEQGARGARVLTNLGNLLRARGDLAGAFERHTEALAIDGARLGNEHPQMGRHHHNRAGIRKAQGRIEEAVAEYELALAIKQRGLGKEHPEVALTLNSLGIVEQERGELDKARALYAEAIRIYTLTAHEQRAVVEKNLATLTPSASASAGPSATPPRPTARPSPTAKPSATGASGNQPSYMPSPAWP